MLISIVVPAFNEEAYIGETLKSLNRAKEVLKLKMDLDAEIIVVNNASEDSTSEVARSLNAAIELEMQRNVARVRNSGERVSHGDVLVFVDADTVVPEALLTSIASRMLDSSCLGGAVDTDYRPRKFLVHLYLQFWRLAGRLLGMAQGATQFCRRDIFLELRGYDETLFMGEDVDFYWRLKRIAKRQNGIVSFIENPKVMPSPRRFDQWRLWRTLVWTNPLFILLFKRRRSCWSGWYNTAPRGQRGG